MHNSVSIGVGIMVSDVGRVRVGGLVELMVWRSTWEEFVGGVRGSRCGLGYVGGCGCGCGCGCEGGGGLSI